MANERECSYCKQFSLGVLRRFQLSHKTVETPVNLNSQMAMVAAGKGVSIASEAMLGIRFPGVRFLPFQETMPRTRLGIAWRTKDTSSSLQLFHQTLIRVACRTAGNTSVLDPSDLPCFEGPAAPDRLLLRA